MPDSFTENDVMPEHYIVNVLLDGSKQETIKVYTTKQLSALLDVTAGSIRMNFSRNKKHFIEGEHYFELIGDSLIDFKKSIESPAFLRNASHLKLWTEKGAMMIAKSCRHEQAWKFIQKI